MVCDFIREGYSLTKEYAGIKSLKSFSISELQELKEKVCYEYEQLKNKPRVFKEKKIVFYPTVKRMLTQSTEISTLSS